MITESKYICYQKITKKAQTGINKTNYQQYKHNDLITKDRHNIPTKK